MKFRQSLSLSARLKLLTLLWVGSALFSVILTLILSWRLEGAGAAINDAGNLRTQTYRMTYMVGHGATGPQINRQIVAFEQALAAISKENLVHPLIPSHTPLSYDLIQSMLQIDWENNVRPALLRRELPSQVDLYRFTGNLELFVQALENANRKNTLWLRRFQMALILMIFVAAGFMIMLHYAWIIRPLETLREGVRAVGRGEFGVSVPTDHIREFAQVSRGFNRMSASLQTLYTDLEGQVARQTEDLARQNRDLALLYQTTRDLHQIHRPRQAAEEFLARTVPAVSAEAGRVLLLDRERKRADLAASFGRTDTTHTRSETFPIVYQEEELGSVELYFSDGIQLQQSDHELLHTLAGQLGVSIANNRFAQESRQLAVLQERNLIAQGLHDSIAQTLTFLNLQVQMLESAFSAGQKEQAEENVRFIKDGVQECYDDVRELLLNFRTKISNKDFPEAVATLLARFEQQTQIEVETVWTDEGPSLGNDEQLQVIFILQESLSNIRKHAHARRVTVSLLNRRDFTLIIRDDGVGFDTGRLNTLSGEHVGLGIMQERARRIRAVLNVESQPQQGTTVVLLLPHSERSAA
ncbi:histidine kinase [Bergeriella denitrificans]|uniref:Sensor protein n=1 Tax=Bergeriella denitrificans TaxID=494 RepID=A0A378UEZ0_BERDE|nr:histidine kinase [Bergeriella denitrificans]STZ75760.1 NarX/NarQ [Bergeriella denitrificans]